MSRTQAISTTIPKRLNESAPTISSQLEDLSGQVLEYSSEVDGSTSTNSLSIVSLSEHSVDTTDGELETGLAGSRLLGFGIGSSCCCCFSSFARHVCEFGCFGGVGGLWDFASFRLSTRGEERKRRERKREEERGEAGRERGEAEAVRRREPGTGMWQNPGWVLLLFWTVLPYEIEMANQRRAASTCIYCIQTVTLSS